MTTRFEYPFKSHYAMIDGVRLHYLDEGQGPVIWLMHGNTTWSYLYRKMIPVLVQAGYRCFVPDLMGFGLSDKPGDERAYSLQCHVAQMASLIEHVGLRDLIVLGQDWGGPITLRYAIEHKNNIRALVLLNTFVQRFPANARERRKHDMITGALPPGFTFLFKRGAWSRFVIRRLDVFRKFVWMRWRTGNPSKLLGAGFRRAVDPRAMANYREIHQKPASRAGLVTFPAMIPDRVDHRNANYIDQIRHELARWKIPLLVVWADGDMAWKPDEGERIARMAPEGEFYLVRNAGHFLQEDAGEEVALRVSEFLDRKLGAVSAATRTSIDPRPQPLMSIGMTKIKVLVTGATGFLGANILRALMARDDVEAIAACRDAAKLPAKFSGEIRCGDLMDANYCRSVVREVDVICHAAAWASMWGHRQLERERFYAPACRLIDAAIEQGVRRFIIASTVAVNKVREAGVALDDFGVADYVDHWPHLNMLIDVEHYMRARATPACQMVVLRLGHFIGRGNRLGLLPALVPRLKTHLVPWLAGGSKRMPLVADTDLGQAFALAAVAAGLKDYESFNICGAEFPPMRDVLKLIAQETGAPLPHFSVPYPLGYVFGGLMEALNPLLPGSPFLTRSIVHLSEEWVAPNEYAQARLGYVPQKDWRLAVREHLADLKAAGYPWPPLSQVVSSGK